MRPILSVIFLVFLSASRLALAQQRPQPASPEKAAAHNSGATLTSEDAQALREDLTRMRALVNQLQNNLAFVDASQSPLKHQFQLEIELWNTLMAGMERRLAIHPR